MMARKDDGLAFDADFESGSMDRMLRMGANWYYLFLRPDEYAFFYFRVKGCKGREIIFEFERTEKAGGGECPICASKPSILPAPSAAPCSPEPAGPKPRVSYDGKTWDVVEHMEKDPRFPRRYRFVHTFREDVAYVCYTQPHTYSDMQAWLETVKENPLVKAETIGESRNGVAQPLLTITADAAAKDLVVLIAREDSDETLGSWGIEGLVQRLLAPESRDVLKRHTFKIVPMVSVDGVLAGTTHSAGYGYGGGLWHLDPSPAEIENVKRAIREWVAQGYRLKLAGKLHGGSYLTSSQEPALKYQDTLVMTDALSDALSRYTDDYWVGRPNPLQIRPPGFFERFILDAFGIENIFATHIQAATPENARRCGEGLMKNIAAWLSETSGETGT